MIDSPNFGSLDVPSDKVIEFPAGLPGFEDCKHFTLVEVDAAPQIFAVLQSVDRPEVAFSVTTPDLLGLQYEFTLTEEEEQLLRVEKADDVAVLLILRGDDKEAPHRRANDVPVKANLMAPLVVNAHTWRGFQKVIGKLGCDVTLRAAE